MRTSKEMADLVFQIRDEHLEKKNRFRIIKKVRKEGKTFRRKLDTIIVSKAQSIKKEPFRYSTAAASLLGVVGVGVGAIAMWQALKEPVPDNIDPRPPIIVHTTASSQTTTTINTTETTVTLVTTVSESETAEHISEETAYITETPKVITTIAEPVTEKYVHKETSFVKSTTVTDVTTIAEATTAVTTVNDITTTIGWYEHYMRNPTSVEPMFNLEQGVYHVRNKNIDKSEVDSYEITWSDKYSIHFFERNSSLLIFTDVIDIMGVNSKDDPDKYIIAYFPIQDVYALYEAMPQDDFWK